MDPEQVSAVRRFNRLVTQRVGALDDRYLDRRRPLGEARVLWEIGEHGRDVRALRSVLDLDSGYLSRLLRSLEADGMVTVGVSEVDRRVRTARLTRSGKSERAVLDRRSDDLAKAMLEPLSKSQRDRLVHAMEEIEQILTAALVHIDIVDPGDPRAQHCLRAYFSELGKRFGFDPAHTLPVDAEDARPPNGIFLVAMLRNEPVGCGALKVHGTRPAEIKRMWVAPSARGLGLGRRLLQQLEDHARARGKRRVRLDTNRALNEAIAMYRSAGYREVPAFNDEPFADFWFEKGLQPHSRR